TTSASGAGPPFQKPTLAPLATFPGFHRGIGCSGLVRLAATPDARLPTDRATDVGATAAATAGATGRAPSGTPRPSRQFSGSGTGAGSTPGPATDHHLPTTAEYGRQGPHRLVAGRGRIPAAARQPASADG